MHCSDVSIVDFEQVNTGRPVIKKQLYVPDSKMLNEGFGYMTEIGPLPVCSINQTLSFTWLGKIVNSTINKISNFMSPDQLTWVTWFNSPDYTNSSK